MDPFVGDPTGSDNMRGGVTDVGHRELTATAIVSYFHSSPPRLVLSGTLVLASGDREYNRHGRILPRSGSRGTPNDFCSYIWVPDFRPRCYTVVAGEPDVETQRLRLT